MSAQHEQGVGGVKKIGEKGNHLDQGPAGAKKRGGISQKGGKIPANVPSPSASGSHTDPTISKGETTGVRGGGGLQGHDRTKPGAEAGSKNDQQPGLQGRNTRQKHNYLGG